VEEDVKRQRMVSRIELIRRQRERILREFKDRKISFPEAVQQLHFVGFEIEVACSIMRNCLKRATRR
jgi:hypothetical protein